jgi:hypothetical protein
MKLEYYASDASFIFWYTLVCIFAKNSQAPVCAEGDISLLFGLYFSYMRPSRSYHTGGRCKADLTPLPRHWTYLRRGTSTQSVSLITNISSVLPTMLFLPSSRCVGHVTNRQCDDGQQAASLAQFFAMGRDAPSPIHAQTAS